MYCILCIKHNVSYFLFFQELSSCLGEVRSQWSQLHPQNYANWLLAPPDTLSLVPNAVAVVDLGDTIIVRCGEILATKGSTGRNEVGEQLLLEAVGAANTLAQSRYPVAKMIVLGQPGMSKDRLLYSRLSPTHRDPFDSMRLFNNAVTQAKLTHDQLSQLVESCMPTDQPTFTHFLSRVVPKVAQYRNQAAFGQPSRSGKYL
jgi:hypothetical protein